MSLRLREIKAENARLQSELDRLQMQRGFTESWKETAVVLLQPVLILAFIAGSAIGGLYAAGLLKIH